MITINKFFREYMFVLAVFVLWRLYITFSEVLGFFWLPFKHSFPYWDSILVRTGFPQMIWQWANFDGVHYLDLANGGYDGFGTQVFFPLYPMLTTILGKIVLSNLVSALIISHVSILLASIILFRILTKEYGKNTAKWGIVFLFSFPASFFLGSVYTESLFLLLLLCSFVLTGLAGAIAGLLTSLTRLIGVFLSLVMVQRPKKWLAIFPIGGLFVYMLYLYQKFSNPLLFLTAQGAFRNGRATQLSSLVSPPQVIFRYLKIFASGSYYHYDYWVAILEFSSFLLGVWILADLTLNRKVKREYLYFCWPALLLPTFSGTLSSMPRYLLTTFPIYIGLALIKSRIRKLAILSASLILQAILTALFTRGYWVS